MLSTQNYPNRILLAITGSSPAIVSETLYALTQTSDEPFIPTEIHIITTKHGYHRIKETLLGENGQIKKLCDDYQLERPIFAEQNIHQIRDDNGEVLADITTEKDNEITANFITTKLREFTRSDDTSLHVSIAGGRKTMTYYMGYAMSVFARIQDQMSHVLIDDKYLSSGFYYPTPESKKLKTGSGETFDASQVSVMLGRLPFIRLRDGLTDDLLNKQLSFGEIIEIAQRQLLPIRIELKTGKLFCGGYPVELAAADLSLYIWLLRRHQQGQTTIRFEKAQQQALTQQFLEVYEELSGGSEHFYKLTEETFKQDENGQYKVPMDSKYFGEHRTKINNAIQKALGKPAAQPYVIQSAGKRNAMQYALSDKVLPNDINLNAK
jgi:CRISPR-associated protein (TIGR02584 family)